MPPRTAMLGLDGVPFSLLKELINGGVMPNLAKFAARGTLVPMNTTFPEVSSVSWTSFMTGKNPGEHGIYGFMELKPGTYQMAFPNSLDIMAETVWDKYSRSGRQSIVLNMPQTYPAKPLNGILTAGFIALDLKTATYPESAYRYLAGIGYKIDVDAEKARRSAAALADDITATFRKRREAFLHYIAREPWDLFIAVVTETDRLNHFFWDAWQDKDHPWRQFFLDFYREIDAMIGELAAQLPADTAFYLLSDHGFTGIKQEVNLSFWLRQEGYLTFSKEPPDSLQDIGDTSVAFALDPSRIYIHLKGKYPRGSVKQSDYGQVRSEIREKLLKLEQDNQPVIRAVYFKEEIYKGPYLDRAPDLVVWADQGYDLKASIKKRQIFCRTHFTGAHTRDDAFFLSAQPIDLPPNLQIDQIIGLLFH